MANLTVDANAKIKAGSRVSVRSSADRVYIVGTNSIDQLFVKKGNQVGEPTSFTQVTSTATGMLNTGGACAIDSVDKIHIMAYVKGAIREIRYWRYDIGTDAFDITNETLSVFTDSADVVPIELLAIAVDANNDPHAVWNDEIADMGADREVIFYANRIGGTWSARLEIQISNSNASQQGIDIFIGQPTNAIGADRPIIAANGQDGADVDVLNAWHGNALNATSFVKAPQIAGPFPIGILPANRHVSMAIDSNNNIYINFVQQKTNAFFPFLVKHLATQSDWTIWETPVVVNEGKVIGDSAREVAVAINQTDRFAMFTRGSFFDDIELWLDQGAGNFAEETADPDLPNLGNFQFPKLKWQSINNNTPRALDYVFQGNTNNVLYNSFLAPTVKAFSVDAVLNLGNVIVDLNALIDDGNRVTFRSADNFVYVVVNAGGNIRMYKGNQAGEPTSFIEQDVANAPDNVDFISVAGIISSTGLIDVYYYDNDSVTPEIKRAIFQVSSDTWTSIDLSVVALDRASGSFINPILAPMLTSAGVQQLAYVDEIADMTVNKQTVFYVENSSGWSARLLVQQAFGIDEQVPGIDAIIAEPTSAIGADRPIIILSGIPTDQRLKAYHGDALIATSFVEAIDIAVGGGTDSKLSVAIDSAGKITVAYADTTEGTARLEFVEHLASQSDWTIWETRVIITSARSADPSLAINGTNRYIYVQQLLDEKIHLFKDEGAGFSEETADPDLPNFGPFSDVHVKNAPNNTSPSNLDYVFQQPTTGAVWYNTFQGVGVNEFTVDAILIRAGQFTVDAITSAPFVNFNFTVDANIQATQTLGFTVDVQIKVIQTNTFLVDGFIQATQTDTFDVDAILLATQTNDFSVDAFVQATQTNDFTNDGLIQQQNNDNTFTNDAIIKAIQTETFLVDAFLRATQVNDFTVDALTQTPASVMFSLNALVQAVNQTNAFSVDARVRARVDEQFTVDARLAQLNEFTVDGRLAQRNTFTVDGIIQLVKSDTFLVNAIVKALNTNQDFTVDAIVLQINANTFTVDGIISNRFDNDFTIDAVIADRNTTTFTTDAFVQALNTNNDFIVDGNVQGATTVNFSVDALVQTTQTNDFTVDAILQSINTNTFSVDADLRAIGSTGGNRIDLDGLVFYLKMDDAGNPMLNSPRASGGSAYDWTGGLAQKPTNPNLQGRADGTPGFSNEGVQGVIHPNNGGSLAIFNGGADFTLNLWVKLDALPPGQGVRLLWSRGPFPENGQNFLLKRNPSGNLKMSAQSAVNGSTSWSFISTINGPPIDGTWHMITFRHDNALDQVTFNIDAGANDVIAGTGGVGGIDGGPRFLLSDDTPNNTEFIGNVDEFTGWTRRITDAEMQILFSESPPQALDSGQNEFSLVDALISETNSLVFSANAKLIVIVAGEFTVNAQLIRASQISVDAILTTPSGEFEFSDVHLQDVAHLFIQPKIEFTINARIKAIPTETFTVNAIIVGRNEFTVDARIKQIQTETFLVDGLAQITPSFTWNNDALLQVTKTFDFTADAIIKATQTNEFTVDGLLRVTQTNDFTVDAQLNKVHEFTVDARVRARQTFDFIVDGTIEEAKIDEFTVDAQLVRANQFTVDALTQQLNINQDFIVDANVQEENSKSFSLDALLILQKVHTFLVDGLVQRLNINQDFTVDAILAVIFAEIDVQLVTFETPPQPAVFFDVDALIVQRNDQTFQVDGRVVRPAIDFDFSVNAILSAVQTNEFTVDAFLGIFARLVHTSIIRDNLKTTSVIRRRSK